MWKKCLISYQGQFMGGVCALYTLCKVLFKQPLTSSQQMGKSLAIRFEEQLLSVFTKPCTWSVCWQIVNWMGNVWCLLNMTYVKHCRSQPGVNLKCCRSCPAQDWELQQLAERGTDMWWENRSHLEQQHRPLCGQHRPLWLGHKVHCLKAHFQSQ